MLEYEAIELKEFSLLWGINQAVYHLRGTFCLNEGGKCFYPVTRSYIDSYPGTLNRETLAKNRLPHEDVVSSSCLFSGEKIFNIYGRRLLFLSQQSGIKEVSSRLDQNKRHVSVFVNQLVQAVIVGVEPKFRDVFGVFGSHQIDVAGPESDVDLIAWVMSVERSRLLYQVNEQLTQLGWMDTKKTNKNSEYAFRYSRKFGIPVAAGNYLASKRNRWVSEAGASISLQVLNIPASHKVPSAFFAGLKNQWSKTRLASRCWIVDSSYAFNFPRVWLVSFSNEIVPVLSFNWRHQGMAVDNDYRSRRYVFKGCVIDTIRGRFGFLERNDDYILPEDVL